MGIFDKMFSKLHRHEFSEFVIGRKFPLEGYNSLGDYIRVALNNTSFDVVISLSGLSVQEEKAIGDDEFEVYVAATDLVPFVIMKFGNVFKADMTINIHKMNSEFRDTWLRSDVDTVRIFLLEGNDATLKCIRSFKFETIDFLKSVCGKQLTVSKADVDSHINAAYQQFPIEKMVRAAQVKFTVPASIRL